ERGQNERGATARRVRPAGVPPAGATRSAAPVAKSRVPVPPNELPLPRPLQALLDPRRVSLADRHPGLQLDKYSRGGEQTEQKEALTQVASIAGHAALFGELRRRRDESLQALGVRAWCRTTAGPLTLHLARAAAMENAGICLHPVYGFTYLPRTGLKGMTRAYAETVAKATPAEVPAAFANDPGEPEKERQRAGAVIFHDAWPSAWPRLVVDIVNNHHAAYYQGDQPPGDWDSPMPVYFLAVAGGQEFSFALGKRRPDVPDQLL